MAAPILPGTWLLSNQTQLYRRRRWDSNPRIGALQAPALPLGHVAMSPKQTGGRTKGRQSIQAGDRTRTGDLLLGKETFYQLNYARARALQLSPVPRPGLEPGTHAFSVRCSTN